MDTTSFLLFIVGFIIGMIFLRWISKNKRTSKIHDKKRVHFEDKEQERNLDSSTSIKKEKTNS